MPINQAMYTGVTGLASNADNMSIIANNIANANNRSFKTDRGEFEDLLTVSLSEASTLGRGARLRGITTDFQQGALTTTGGITDLGIQGDGFFAVKNLNTEVQESGGMFYTRQGSFRFDKEGYLSDIMGGHVQGYMVDKESKVSSKLTDVQITANSVPPQATRVVSLNVNLDAREKPPVDEFDITRPQSTSNFSTTVTVYDSMGRPHTSTVYFSRGKDLERNSWNWYSTVDGRELKDGNSEIDAEGNAKLAIIGKGEIEFDPEGKPILPFKNKLGRPTYIDMIEKGDAFDVEFASGARPQKLQFNFGPIEDENGAVGNQTSTSIAARSGTLFHSQDGYETGNLKTLKLDLDGSIRGVYTNGLERKLAVIALATFSNNGGLFKAGHNSYTATPKSGTPRVGAPQTGTRGSVYSASLEESNVDLAQQFVDMITTQRGFQANSKSITTTDSMIEEIINLKR